MLGVRPDVAKNVLRQNETMRVDLKLYSNVPLGLGAFSSTTQFGLERSGCAAARSPRGAPPSSWCLRRIGSACARASSTRGSKGAATVDEYV